MLLGRCKRENIFQQFYVIVNKTNNETEKNLYNVQPTYAKQYISECLKHFFFLVETFFWCVFHVPPEGEKER